MGQEKGKDGTTVDTLVAVKRPEPVRAFGGLMCIPDGYTLRGTVKDAEGKKPPLEIMFRPAVPDDVYAYQIELAAVKVGGDRMAAQVRLIDAHLVSWSGLYKPSPLGQPVAVPFVPGTAGTPGTLADSAVRRGLGPDYIAQIINYVTGYEPGRWEEDAKN